MKVVITTWQYNYDDYLYHHGIKGMRWGVRRFQKKDGSLTAAGRKRYDDDSPTAKNTKSESQSKPKSKHRQRLEQKYINAGMSPAKAAKEADKRIKAEKMVALMAGVAVGACAGYAASKYIRNRTDGIIKSTDVLQRIEMKDTGGKLHDVFYTSAGKHDNKRYQGMLGMTRQQQTGHAYLMKLHAKEDIKVASKDKAAKIFGELYKNDTDFRNAVEKHAGKHFTGKNKVDTSNLSDRNIRKMYENFNSGLIHIRDEKTGADKKFYDKLKSAGYGAIQDINDMKYSGYNARNPLIVFDNSNQNITVKSVRELTKEDNVFVKGLIEAGKASAEQKLKEQGQQLLVIGTAASVGVAGAMYVEDHIDPNAKNPKKHKTRKSR